MGSIWDLRGSGFAPGGSGNGLFNGFSLNSYGPTGIPFSSSNNGASGANYDFGGFPSIIGTPSNATDPKPIPLEQPESNSYINTQIFIDQDKTVEFDSSVSQLIWINTDTYNVDGRDAMYDRKAWGPLNAYLKSPIGRLEWGKDDDTSRLRTSWVFFGPNITHIHIDIASHLNFQYASEDSVTTTKV